MITITISDDSLLKEEDHYHEDNMQVTVYKLYSSRPLTWFRMEHVEKHGVRLVEVGKGDVGRGVKLARRDVEQAVDELHVEGAVERPLCLGNGVRVYVYGGGQQVGLRVETAVGRVHSGVALRLKYM